MIYCISDKLQWLQTEHWQKGFFFVVVDCCCVADLNSKPSLTLKGHSLINIFKNTRIFIFFIFQLNFYCQIKTAFLETPITTTTHMITRTITRTITITIMITITIQRRFLIARLDLAYELSMAKIEKEQMIWGMT